MARTKKTAAVETATTTSTSYTTPADRVDSDGIYIPVSNAGLKEYEKLQKAKNRDALINGIKTRYIYDPDKEHMNVRVIFVKQVLAMSPGDKDLYANFIAQHAIDAAQREDEINTLGVKEVITKGRSVFDRINGQIVWPSRRWLGFFKSRMKAQRQDTESDLCAMTSYTSKLDENISFGAEWYPVKIPKDGKITICDRTIPGDGFKRETSIKSSEAAPAGTIMNFRVQTNIHNIGSKTKGVELTFLEAIRQCLDAGIKYGTGEWRGSGKQGTFVWEELDDDGKVIGGNTAEIIGCYSSDKNFKDKFWSYVDSHLIGEEDSLEL